MLCRKLLLTVLLAAVFDLGLAQSPPEKPANNENDSVAVKQKLIRFETEKPVSLRSVEGELAKTLGRRFEVSKGMADAFVYLSFSEKTIQQALNALETATGGVITRSPDRYLLSRKEEVTSLSDKNRLTLEAVLDSMPAWSDPKQSWRREYLISQYQNQSYNWLWDETWLLLAHIDAKGDRDQMSLDVKVNAPDGSAGFNWNLSYQQLGDFGRER